MLMLMKVTTTPSAILALGALVSPANAASLRITVEAPSNVGLAPALLSFHDGSVDFFDTGSAASAGLELLAEVGDTSLLQGSLAAGSDNVTIANGGPFFPGNSNTVTFDISDTNTLLSFAAMILPSNDWFIGNNNAIDISSIITGGLGATNTFDFGRVYDAGTEAEDFMYSPGNGIIGITTPATPGDGTATTDVISLVDQADPFGSFANTSAGFDSTIFDFNAAGVGNTILGRITITNVPEPSSIALVSLAGLGLIGRRKRS